VYAICVTKIEQLAATSGQPYENFLEKLFGYPQTLINIYTLLITT